MKPPETRRAEVVDVHHGVRVADPYRWLEADDDPEVRAFIAAQNAYARTHLDALPGRAAVRARVAEILGARIPTYGDPTSVAGKLFAMKFEPPAQQRKLVVRTSADAGGEERVVVDPQALDPTSGTAIDWYRPSPDGRLVAVSLSSGGSETGNLHVFDVATGGGVHEIILGVNAGTAGGDVAWLPDGSGFYYTRYPRAGERPEEERLFHVQLHLHRLGTPPAADTYEIGRDFPRIAELFVDVHASGALLLTVQNGDGGEFMFHLRGRDGTWRKLASFEDRAVQMVFGERDDLYAISRKDAPRGRLLCGPVEGFDLAKARVVVPEDTATLVSDVWNDRILAVHGGRVHLTYQLGGPSEVRTFDLDGKRQPGPGLPPVTGVAAIVPYEGDSVLVASSSYLTPMSWHRFSPATGETRRTALSAASPVDLSKVTVLRETARSRDGTEVPVNILLPPGVAPGEPVPFVVTGYGGYGACMDPWFHGVWALYLENGVAVAEANLRGGGEFGEEWHRAGSLTKKQNVFDDMIGVLEHLVRSGRARPGRVAAFGGSNGGLLMGAVVTQRPDLVCAVSSSVGFYDSVRTELEPNGAFNTTEFGTVAVREQFEALYAYSPYHLVRDGSTYPPVLMQTGANDIRVAPWQSRKMAARLQAAQAGPGPILIVTDDGAGHGMGTPLDHRIETAADECAFLLAHLGVGPRSSR